MVKADTISNKKSNDNIYIFGSHSSQDIILYFDLYITLFGQKIVKIALRKLLSAYRTKNSILIQGEIFEHNYTLFSESIPTIMMAIMYFERGFESFTVFKLRGFFL